MNKETLIEDLKHIKDEYDLKAGFLTDIIQGKELGHNEILCTKKMNELEDNIKKLKEENQNHIKDIDCLKDLVRRLNVELNRYHDPFGPLQKHLENEHSFEKEILGQHGNLHKLNSLLYAYDEVIDEQNDTIRNIEKQYEDAMEKVKILMAENETAFKYIEMMKAEPCKDQQLKIVVADARLVMEERDLLLSEIRLLHQRKLELESENEEKVLRLESHLNGTESNVKTLKLEVEKQKEELLSLHKENNFLKMELKSSVKKEEHKKAVLQCSRLLEKLNYVHKNDTLNMKSKVQLIKSEQEQLLKKLSNSSEQFKVIKKEAFGYKTNLRKHNSKLSQQAEVIKIQRKHRKSLEIKMKQLTQILSQLIHDRKSLLLTLQHYKKEIEKYAMVAKLRCNEIGKLSLKLKDENFRFSQKLAETEGRRQATEEAWHHAIEDATRVRKLLQQKDEDLKRYLNGLYNKSNS